MKDIYGAGAAECGLLLVPERQEDKRRLAEDTLRLPQMMSADDLSLILLQKPQYPFEVLTKLASAKALRVPIIDINGKTLAAAEQRARSFESEGRRLGGAVEMFQRKAEQDATTIKTLADVLLVARTKQRADHALISKRFDDELSHVADKVTSLIGTVRQRDASIAQLGDALSELNSQVHALQGHVDTHIERINDLVNLISGSEAKTLRRFSKRLRAKPSPTTTEHKVKVLAASEDPKSHFYIERALCIGQELHILGWFFNEEGRTLGATLTVQTPRFLQTFRLQSGRERRDVASEWNNVLAIRSGFRAVHLLDASAGRAQTAVIAFAVEGRSEPIVYTFVLSHTPYSEFRVARHIVRRLNPRRIKVGLNDLVHGRVDSLWLRLNHVFQHRNRTRSIQTRNTDLAGALALLSPEPARPGNLPAPVDIVIPAYNCLQYLDPLFEKFYEQHAVHPPSDTRR